MTALDGLRGIAATIVLLRHTFNAVVMPPDVRRGILESPLAPLLNGQGAVQLFFVLSGFVLAMSLSRDTRLRSVPAFYAKRILRIQPAGGISLHFDAKQPGEGMQLRGVSMDFHYGSSFGVREPTAYETLLLDAIVGDGTLYARQDMVEASWAAVEPILEVWANEKQPFPNYGSGTWGPAASDEMLARNGRQWRTP